MSISPAFPIVKGPFEVLGLKSKEFLIPEGASKTEKAALEAKKMIELKKAYRSKMRTAHPDLKGAKSKAASEEIQAAYEVLSDNRNASRWLTRAFDGAISPTRTRTDIARYNAWSQEIVQQWETIHAEPIRFPAVMPQRIPGGSAQWDQVQDLLDRTVRDAGTCFGRWTPGAQAGILTHGPLATLGVNADGLAEGVIVGLDAFKDYSEAEWNEARSTMSAPQWLVAMTGLCVDKYREPERGSGDTMYYALFRAFTTEELPPPPKRRQNGYWSGNNKITREQANYLGAAHYFADPRLGRAFLRDPQRIAGFIEAVDQMATQGELTIKHYESKPEYQMYAMAQVAELLGYHVNEFEFRERNEKDGDVIYANIRGADVHVAGPERAALPNSALNINVENSSGRAM